MANFFLYQKIFIKVVGMYFKLIQFLPLEKLYRMFCDLPPVHPEIELDPSHSQMEFLRPGYWLLMGTRMAC